MENGLQNTNWEDALEIHSDHVDKSFERHDTIDRHAQLKKMSLKECKLKLKPWLTKDILTSINNKNFFLKKSKFSKQYYQSK